MQTTAASSTRIGDVNLPTVNKIFVIDTISFKCNWPLRMLTHNDWQFTWQQRDLPTGEDESECSSPRTFKAKHRLFRIHIEGVGDRISLVNVALPRMIHANNAVLIQGQEQVDEALGNLNNIIDEIADTSSSLLYFTRVDLVWQFQHSPAALIRAHRHCVFPRCQVNKREYSERSASWDYCDKRIIMYDKRLKDRRAPGNVVRVEVQLHKEPLKQYLAGDADYVTELNFARCYQAYRTLMITFAPSQPVTTPQNKYEAFALMERQAQAAGIDSPMELFLSTMKPRTAREWRRQFTSAQLRIENFRWEDVLPESGPPIPVSAY